MATGGQKEVGFSLVNNGTLTLENADPTPCYTSLVVSGDMVMVVDCMAKNIRFHRIQDGKLLATTVKMDSEPRSIFVTKDTEIGVLLLDGHIEIMSVLCIGDRCTITRGRTLQIKVGFDYCHRAVKFMDKAVVCGGKQDNTIGWCIVSLNDGYVEATYPICKGDGHSRSYLTIKDNIIYIACYAGDKYLANTGVHAYDIKNPIKHKYVYKHNDLNLPRGITVDTRGYLFVCNGYPERIHHLTDRCKPVTIYTVELWSPRAIFWDQQHELLYLTSWMRNSITQFKPVYSDQQVRINTPKEKIYAKHQLSGKPSTSKSKRKLKATPKETVVKKKHLLLEPNTSDITQMYEQDILSTVLFASNDEENPFKGDHSAPEVLLRDEGKQPVIKEASTEIRKESGQASSLGEEGQGKVQGDVVCLSALQGQASPLGEEGRGKVQGDVESKEQAGKGTDLQDGDEFLGAIIKNNQKIEEIIRNQKIPKQSIIEVAMKRDKYSIGVQRVLMEMSKFLRMEISEAVGVWCGYRPEDPHTPVFVVTLKNQKCILKKEEIPEPFMGYKIITRYKYVPDDEERSIVEQFGSMSVRSEDVARVNNCIAKHTESLMREHSNLSIIRPCPIKTSGYMRKQMKVKTDTCIVFYVPVKGIIPVGENEFPKDIDGIVTDVREGEFVLFGDHNAMLYHQNIRIGCCISRCRIGSLGGFVDLPGGKVGCLTAAHVVLTDEEFQKYILKEDEEKRKFNYSLAQGEELIEMHQPQPLPAHKSFGKVHTIALEAGNIFTPSVDAAIIQITDDGRKPETGNFPDGNFENIGLIRENPLLYTSGELVDDTETCQNEPRVIKFGCTTGLTNGCLTSSESSVRPVDVWGNYCFPVMFKQFEVLNQEHEFAAVGDSGALVFLCVGQNIRNLRALGLVIGGNSAGGSCIITPIKAVFEKLGLTSNMFKVFPASQLSQLVEHINAQGQVQSQQNEVLNRLSEKIESIEQKLIDTMEQKINEHVHSGLSANFNSSVKTLDENIKESSEKISSRVDTLEKNIKENCEKINSLEKNMKEINSNITKSFDNVIEKLNQMNSKY